jgi:hypothetical protein
LYTSLGIRGVDNRHGAVAGIYLDDTEIPPVRLATYMRPFPPTFDSIASRSCAGPQSTLLGGHTQAGAVRFFTISAEPHGVLAVARTEWATICARRCELRNRRCRWGPLVSDVLGFRVSGWYRADGGYVDPRRSIHRRHRRSQLNSYVTQTMRGTLTFAPTEGVRITPSLTYQSTGITTAPHSTATVQTPAVGI